MDGKFVVVWHCPRCRYQNSGGFGCRVCGEARPDWAFRSSMNFYGCAPSTASTPAARAEDDQVEAHDKPDE